MTFEPETPASHPKYQKTRTWLFSISSSKVMA